MSETRVAPVRKISLPRLELMAAVITARLFSSVKDAIDCHINRIVCWTDNSLTLNWMRGSATRWKPFVGNRAIEIRFRSLVFGDIAQDCRIQPIYPPEAYLQVI